MDIYFVFILTNPARSLLCVHVTSDLVSRMREYEGRKPVQHSFPGRFRCYQLVYYEEYHRPEEADERGRELRSWKRPKKERLVSRVNPHWRPLNGHFTWRPLVRLTPELSRQGLPF